MKNRRKTKVLLSHNGLEFYYFIPTEPNKYGKYSTSLTYPGPNPPETKLTKRVQDKSSVEELIETIETKTVYALYNDVCARKNPSSGKSSNDRFFYIENFLKQEYNTIASPAGYNWDKRTKRDYLRIINKVVRHLPLKPFRLLSGADYEDAIVARIKEYNSKQQTKAIKNTNPDKKHNNYEDATEEKIYSIFNQLLEYAASLGYIEENELQDRHPSINKQPKSAVTRIKKRRQTVKSLTSEESIALWNIISENILDEANPICLLAAIMDATGLRTAEACGLKYSGIIDLMHDSSEDPVDSTEPHYKEGDPAETAPEEYGVPEDNPNAPQYTPAADSVYAANNKPEPSGKCAFVVVSQAHAKTKQTTNILKTDNAYRRIPIHYDLYDLITKKRDALIASGYSDAEIDSMYIVHSPKSDNNPQYLRKPMPYAAVSKLFKKLLADVCEHKARSNDLLEAYTEEYKDDSDPLIDEATYVLRRNFCTNAFAVCAMDADEVRYLMGHEQFTERRDSRHFSDRDGQLSLLEKLNRRPLLSTETLITNTTLSLEYPIGTVKGTHLALFFPSEPNERICQMSFNINEPGKFSKMQTNLPEIALDIPPRTAIASAEMNVTHSPDFSYEYRKKYSEIQKMLSKKTTKPI